MINIINVNGKDEKEYIKKLKERSAAVNGNVTKSVAEIINDVRDNGDEAVKKYTLRFDTSTFDCIEVNREQINDALTEADQDYVDALLNAMANITEYHTRQKQQSYIDTKSNGCILGQRIRGLKRVGIYIPGGTAAYPSSVLMCAVPARIAGVEEIIMATPPQRDGTANKDILVAAAVCGVDRVFLIGGAQAVAAMAYGTETVPQVDKIVGPGNIYVATAKRLMFGQVDIDMVAGPSEILIIADENANPAFVAADLMSQAEHDVLASSILVTTSSKLANEVDAELTRQIKTLSRPEIITQSINDYGAAFVCDSIDAAIEMANDFAPEHLEVMLDNPIQYIGRLENAGSIFLGSYSPEPLGDYYAGPNHVLPTNGTARFFSPLSVDSFVKKTSFIYYTQQELRNASNDIELLANREGLTAHANSITIRK